MNTPRTNEALAALLERDGELSEDNAPAVLVKLCKELEATTERLWLEIDSRKVIESNFQNEIMSLRKITEKSVALVEFWEEQGGGNGVMARAKEDALIRAAHTSGSGWTASMLRDRVRDRVRVDVLSTTAIQNRVGVKIIPANADVEPPSERKANVQ